MSECTIPAVDFCGPDDGQVDSAERLSSAILDALAVHERVFVSMVSVRGAATSFFNVIYCELAAKVGVPMARQRVEFVGMGRTQTMVANRSREAVLGP